MLHNLTTPDSIKGEDYVFVDCPLKDSANDNRRRPSGELTKSLPSPISQMEGRLGNQKENQKTGQKHIKKVIQKENQKMANFTWAVVAAGSKNMAKNGK